MLGGGEYTAFHFVQATKNVRFPKGEGSSRRLWAPDCPGACKILNMVLERKCELLKADMSNRSGIDITCVTS